MTTETDKTYDEAVGDREAEATDAEAARRLEGAEPGDAEVLGDEPGDRPTFKMKARCMISTIRAGSTTGGSTAATRFQVSVPDAAVLAGSGVIGEQAFDVTFGKSDLGDGYTIKQIVFRPDAEGSAIAYLDLIAPQSATRTASLLGAKNLVGKDGDLVLGPSQVTMEELLVKRAE